MSEPTPPKSGGLWARLLSMGVTEEEPKPMNDEDASEQTSTPGEELPVALPVAIPVEVSSIIVAAAVDATSVETESPAEESVLAIPPLEANGSGSEESVTCPCC